MVCKFCVLSPACLPLVPALYFFNYVCLFVHVAVVSIIPMGNSYKLLDVALCLSIDLMASRAFFSVFFFAGRGALVEVGKCTELRKHGYNKRTDNGVTTSAVRVSDNGVTTFAVKVYTQLFNSAFVGVT